MLKHSLFNISDVPSTLQSLFNFLNTVSVKPGYEVCYVVEVEVVVDVVVHVARS